MATPESSCSSRNQGVGGPLLSGSAGRMSGRGAVHESYDLASDAINKRLAPSLKSVTVCIGIASNAFNGNSPLPKNAPSPSVIHSSWIQRLKPSSQSFAAKDVPRTFSKKDSFVCTHFTKDYSSCGRRLNKFTHHARSSSWPSHGTHSNVVRQLAMEAEEPVCNSPEEHDSAATNSPDCNHQTICVLSKNASQCSEAGSRTGSQQDCQKQFQIREGFVPCAQLIALNRCISSFGRRNNLQDNEVIDRKKLGSYSGQQFQDRIKCENKSDFVAPSEQTKPLGRLQEVQSNNWDYFDDSLPAFCDFVSPLPVSARYSSGASADADASNCYVKPFNFGVLDEKVIDQSGFREFDCKGKYVAADVLRNKNKLDKFGLILPSKQEALQDGFTMGAAAKAYVQNGVSTRPGNAHPSHLNCQRPGVSTKDDATSKSQNIISRGIDASHSRRYNLATSQNPHFGEAGHTSRSFVPIKSFNEDAARARIRERSLEDYWNSWLRLLEEPDYGRPINMDHSKASLQQDFAKEHCYKDCCQHSLGTKKNFGNFDSFKSQKLVNFAQDICPYDSEGQRLFLSRSSGPRINSRQVVASSGHISNFVVDHLELSQEQYLFSHEGASAKVDSQPHTKNYGFHKRFPDDGSSHSRTHSIHPSLKVINNETSGKEWNMHHGWLQRWRSVEKLSCVSGKPLTHYNSQSVSSDQLTKLPKSCCANAQCTVGSSHEDINPLERKLPDFCRGSNRYSEASGTRLDCGSASTSGFRPAHQNFAAFRSSYLGPSIETIAIIGNSAGKQHPVSLQNGRFYRSPCAKPKSFECVTISEDVKGADEDLVHLTDLNDLNSMQGDIGDF